MGVGRLKRSVFGSFFTNCQRIGLRKYRSISDSYHNVKFKIYKKLRIVKRGK